MTAWTIAFLDYGGGRGFICHNTFAGAEGQDLPNVYGQGVYYTFSVYGNIFAPSTKNTDSIANVWTVGKFAGTNIIIDYTKSGNAYSYDQYGRYNGTAVFKNYDSSTDWTTWDLTPAYNISVVGAADDHLRWTSSSKTTNVRLGSKISTNVTGLTSGGYSYLNVLTNGNPDYGAIQVTLSENNTVTRSDSATSGITDLTDSLYNICSVINAKYATLSGYSMPASAFTIGFDSSVTSVSCTQAISITNPITFTISGNSSTSYVTLNAAADTRIFYATNGTVNLKYLNFTSSVTQSVHGGAMKLTTGDNVTFNIEDCNFSGFNSTNTSGGAVIRNESGTVNFNGTVNFTNNNVSSNGAAIYNNKTITLNGGTITFDGNTASANGGAIYNAGGTLNLSGGTAVFKQNNAASGGGAIYIADGTVTLSGGSFTGNYTSGGSGGAIYAAGGAFSANGGTFVGNYAGKQGGAIMSKIGITLSGVTFGTSGSSSDANHAVNGGAVFLTGSANSTIDNDSKFYYNYATTRGGAIYTQTTGTVTIDGTFDSNGQSGAVDGGAIAASRGTVTVSGTFTNNKATSGGGAIYAQGVSNASITLNSSANYTSNTAGYGGAIRTGNYSKLNVTSGTFASNKATASDGNGGAILNWSGTASGVTNATFTGNTASSTGGAIANFAALTVTNCAIGTSGGNTAQYGAGIFTTGALTLSGTTISNNNATINGGGVSVGSVTMSGTTTFGSIAAGANDSVITANTSTNGGSGLVIGAKSKTSHGTVGTPGAGYIRVYSNSNHDIMSNYVTQSELTAAHITTSAKAALPSAPQMVSVMSNLETINVQEGASAVLPTSGTYLYDVDNDGVYDYQSDSVLTSAELANLGYTPGTYEITVALADADGNPDEEFTYKSTLTVEEAAAPNVACEANTFANGQILALNIAVSGNSATIAQWTINWGDGQTSVIDSLADSISATHAYTAQGTYDVSLQMVDTNGSGAGTWVYLTTHTFGTVQEAEAAALPTEISVTDAAVAETAAKAEIALYWDNSEKEDAFALDLPAAETAAVFDEADAVIFAEVPAAEAAAPTLDLAFASASDADDDDEADAWQIF